MYWQPLREMLDDVKPTVKSVRLPFCTLCKVSMLLCLYPVRIERKFWRESEKRRKKKKRQNRASLVTTERLHLQCRCNDSTHTGTYTYIHIHCVAQSMVAVENNTCNEKPSLTSLQKLGSILDLHITCASSDVQHDIIYCLILVADDVCEWARISTYSQLINEYFTHIDAPK